MNNLNFILNSNNDKGEKPLVSIPPWAYWTLFASMIVVALVSLIIFFWARWKVRKIKEKINTQNNVSNEAKLVELRGENWNKVPYELKDFFGSKSADEDVNSLINNVFLNDAKNVLFVSKNFEYEVSSLLAFSNANISVLANYLDNKKMDLAKQKFPHYFEKCVQTKNLNELKDESFELIYAHNSEVNNITFYEVFYKKLTPNGILIIRQDNRKKTFNDPLITQLKIAQIPYEIVQQKAKFLYIVKKSNNMQSQN